MIVQDWGLIDYERANQKQLDILEQVAARKSEDVLIFCTHPPVVTMGRGASPLDITSWKGTVVESSRGGKATYHGPNQIVIYPIVDLRREHRDFKPRDVHGYLRSLEMAMINGLAALHVKAEARTVVAKDGDGADLSVTGVWVGDKKLASIGIAVRKWITYHGVALNVTKDPLAFSGIRPCGFNASVMTSLEELGVVASRSVIQQKLQGAFLAMGQISESAHH